MPQHYDLVGEKYILKESVTLSKNYSPTHVFNFGNFQQKKGEGGGSTTGMEGPSFGFGRKFILYKEIFQSGPSYLPYRVATCDYSINLNLTSVLIVF